MKHTLSPGNTHTPGLDLIAETPFILPESSRDSWFGARRGELTGSIVNTVIPVGRGADRLASDG